jgi:hypothetical protein
MAIEKKPAKGSRRHNGEVLPVFRHERAGVIGGER